MLRLATLALLTALAATGCVKIEPLDEHTAFDDNGATTASFSVDPARQVAFSRGNLQYQPSTGQWRFAPQQYETLGEKNMSISPTSDSWIDLFGWGTSGWNSGARAYEPYSTSTAAHDYWPGGLSDAGFDGSYANADWGIYNPIASGGFRAGMWHTLSAKEWDYLIAGRTNAGSKVGTATIDGRHHGIVILPDAWIAPEGMRFNPGLCGWSNNRFSVSEWERMEAEGAVFIPAAGYRFGIRTHYTGSAGYYHSSSPASESDILCLYFAADTLAPAKPQGRYLGLAVRLAKDFTPDN